MNILFLMKVMHIGGQETVTIKLANHFVAQGHNVAIASFEKPWDNAVERTDSRINFYTIGDYKYSKENVARLKEVLEKESIDVVINQWGLPFVSAKVLDAAKRGLPQIKVIAVYHNNPESNARLADIDLQLQSSGSLKKRFLKLKRVAFKMITSSSMRYVYKKSDCYMVLSESYVDAFKRFTGIRNPSKLTVLTNPVTIDSADFTYSKQEKKKEIIYVGRIDYNQKRVSRVIDVWKLLEPRFKDWKLTIVGDGEERQNLEKMVESLGLKNVSFEGFRPPLEYYKRASILILVSEYEGFPLVLAECMSFGVIPCVYGSFPAVYDIVEDKQNGVIVPKVTENGFQAEIMAAKVAEIMDDDEMLIRLAESAKKVGENFTIAEIYKKWLLELKKN